MPRKCGIAAVRSAGLACTHPTCRPSPRRQQGRSVFVPSTRGCSVIHGRSAIARSLLRLAGTRSSRWRRSSRLASSTVRNRASVTSTGHCFDAGDMYVILLTLASGGSSPFEAGLLFDGAQDLDVHRAIGVRNRHSSPHLRMGELYVRSDLVDLGPAISPRIADDRSAGDADLPSSRHDVALWLDRSITHWGPKWRHGS